MKIKLLSLLLLLVSLNFFGCKTEKKNGTIDASEIIERINKNQNIFFKNITILGDLDFTRVANQNFENLGIKRTYISSSISFFNCIFKGKVICFGSNKIEKIDRYTFFEKNLTFTSSEFQEEAIFEGITVNGAANFSQCLFLKDANFRGSIFQHPHVFFTASKFKERALFQNTTFNGNVDFFKTNFLSTAHFQWVVFRGDANFASCIFMKNLFADNILSNKSLIFNYSNLKKRADFSNSAIYNRFDFNHTIFEDSLILKRILFACNPSFIETDLHKGLNKKNAKFLLNNE